VTTDATGGPPSDFSPIDAAYTPIAPKFVAPKRTSAVTTATDVTGRIYDRLRPGLVRPSEGLFQPPSINGLEIANRIVMGPMAVLQQHKGGRPSRQTIAFLTERATGVGMIIVGGSAATSRGVDEAPFRPLLRFDSDDLIPDLGRFTAAVHSHGTAIFSQAFAGFGRMGMPGKDRPILTASPKNVHMTEDRLPPGTSPAGGGAVGDVPLFLSSTTDPQTGADAIVSGHGDALMLARQLLADPEYANKVRDGRIDEIVMVRPPKLLPAVADRRSRPLPPEPPHGSGRA